MHRRTQRLLGTLFGLTVVVALSGCGANGTDPQSDSPTSPDAATETAPESQAPDAKGVTVATAETEHGTVQATYNDWPLYYYHEDTKPGGSAAPAWMTRDPDTEPPASGHDH